MCFAPIMNQLSCDICQSGQIQHFCFGFNISFALTWTSKNKKEESTLCRGLYSAWWSSVVSYIIVNINFHRLLTSKNPSFISGLRSYQYMIRYNCKIANCGSNSTTNSMKIGSQWIWTKQLYTYFGRSRIVTLHFSLTVPC